MYFNGVYAAGLFKTHLLNICCMSGTLLESGEIQKSKMWYLFLGNL